jgi:hypothetical protein
MYQVHSVYMWLMEQRNEAPQSYCVGWKVFAFFKMRSQSFF